ncbi:MAG: hypothetical protein AAF572_09355 [Cyanobacteria bacterium P01_B01_bin.77]
MEKEIKYKIRNLWRDRLLMGVTSLIVLGFSTLQLETALAHRAVQPIWVLELSQAVRILISDNKSNQEQEYAISELQRISQARDLQITMLLQHLKWKNLEWQVDRARNWQQAQELTRAYARELVLERVQALERAQEQRRSKNKEKIQQLTIKRDRALALERALALALARDQPLNQNLEVEIVKELSLVIDKNRELDKALAQGLELKLFNDTLFVFIVAAELQETHSFTLQQGSNLESLLNSEPNRARILMTSSFLLGSSLLILIGLLVLLTTYQGSLKLSRTAHLIAFLPEECVAELGYLKQRLQQKNTSPWEIRKHLVHEFLTLFFACYIQVQLENFFLPSGDHTIDD